MCTRFKACAMSKIESSTTGDLDLCNSSGRCAPPLELLCTYEIFFLVSTHNVWEEKQELACVDELAV